MLLYLELLLGNREEFCVTGYLTWLDISKETCTAGLLLRCYSAWLILKEMLGNTGLKVRKLVEKDFLILHKIKLRPNSLNYFLNCARRRLVKPGPPVQRLLWQVKIQRLGRLENLVMHLHQSSLNTHYSQQLAW